MNTKHFFAAVFILSLLAAGLQLAFAVGPTIDIDILPNNDENVINLGSKGVIPVAILSEEGFDATDENVLFRENIKLEGLSVGVRGNDVVMAQERDVNQDTYIDLVVQIEVERPDPSLFEDGFATLSAQTSDGIVLIGIDKVRLVPE